MLSLRHQEKRETSWQTAIVGKIDLWMKASSF
jgi:hypothetical protein